MPRPDQREAVFTRIREALRTPAPHRHVVHATDAAPTPPAVDGLPTTEAFRAWLPLVGPSLDEQIALFAQHSVVLKTDFRVVKSPSEAAQQLAELAATEKWKRVGTHRHPLAQGLAEKLGLPTLLTDAGYAKTELETCDVGISGCEALVAQTGSILVTPASAGGRALSVLPPHHIVIAQRSQMVPDLASALQLVRQRYAPNWPSLLSFITGPSRTGDIERILVLGAHGPRKLTVFLLATD